MCQWGANRNPWAYYRIDLPPDPNVTFNPPNRGVAKYPFEIAAKRLEIDENVKRAHLRTHWLAVNDAMNSRTAFAKAPNEYLLCLRSSTMCVVVEWPGMITIVVMTLLPETSHLLSIRAHGLSTVKIQTGCCRNLNRVTQLISEKSCAL